MAVAFDILARADAVEVAGSYIGFFEWCVFACRLRRRVIVVFGGEDVDVLMHFAPDLCFITDLSPLRVLVCRCLDGMFLHARDVKPHVNHFMHIVPTACPACGNFCKGACRGLGDEPPAGPQSREAFAAWYFQRCYFVVDTRMDGNCGLDAMVRLAADPLEAQPTLENCMKWRRRLAEFMRGHADDMLWQNAYLSCEGPSDHECSTSDSDVCSKGGDDKDTSNSDTSTSSDDSDVDLPPPSKKPKSFSLEYTVPSLAAGGAATLSDDAPLTALLDAPLQGLAAMPNPNVPRGGPDADFLATWQVGDAIPRQDFLQAFIDSLTDDERTAMFDNYHAYREMLRKATQPCKAKPKTGAKRMYNPRGLFLRHTIGKAALRYLASDECAGSRQQRSWLSSFLPQGLGSSSSQSRAPRADIACVTLCAVGTPDTNVAAKTGSWSISPNEGREVSHACPW